MVFEIPEFISSRVIGPRGDTKRRLQTEFGVTISVKRYRETAGSKFNRALDDNVQRTAIVQIVGDTKPSLAAKGAIMDIVGEFAPCGDRRTFSREGGDGVGAQGRCTACERQQS